MRIARARNEVVRAAFDQRFFVRNSNVIVPFRRSSALLRSGVRMKAETPRVSRAGLKVWLSWYWRAA